MHIRNIVGREAAGESAHLGEQLGDVLGLRLVVRPLMVDLIVRVDDQAANAVAEDSVGGLLEDEVDAGHRVLHAPDLAEHVAKRVQRRPHLRAHAPWFFGHAVDGVDSAHTRCADQ